MDTDRIREFVKIVELGSVTKASRALSISQSTLSKHVSELETHFGTQLLDRLPTGVVPTAAGNALYAGAAEVLSRTAQLEARMATMRGVPQRRVSVACYAGYSPTDDAVSLAAERLEKTQPGITVDIVDLGRSHGCCLDMLREGSLDICLSVMPEGADFSGLARAPLVADKLVFAARADSALAQKEGLAVEDLAGEVVWVADEKGQPYCEKAREVLAALGIPCASYSRPPLFGAAGRDMLNVGHGGLGVSLGSMVALLVPRSKVDAVRIIDIPDERLAVQVELVRRSDCTQEVRELADAILGAAEQRG